MSVWIHNRLTRPRILGCLLATALAGSLWGGWATAQDQEHSGPFAGIQPMPLTAGTTYTILDPAFSYAAPRHRGESRVGTVGEIEKTPETVTVEPVCADRNPADDCVLRFEYAFRSADQEEFAGVFFSFGRLAIDTVKQDGTSGPSIDLHQDSTFNLSDLMLNDKDRGISIEALRLRVRPHRQSQMLTVRLELEDGERNKVFTRIVLDSSRSDTLDFTVPLTDFSGSSFDPRRVKLLSLVVEENHFADGVSNPQNGGLDLLFVGLVDSDGPQLGAQHIAGLVDEQLVEEVARRNFEALLRMQDVKTGLVLDRTLFRDLLHLGATGWLLAGLPAAVQRGWITSDRARRLGLKILRFLAEDSLWSDQPTCVVGNSRGLVYRFGGIDSEGLFAPCTGTRKLDAGDLNAVEASPIDTALL